LEGDTWTDIPGASGKTYTLTEADKEATIRAVVSPKSVAGKTAADVFSNELSLGSTAFYVAADGKDSNPGSIDKPFATIDAAKNAVKSALAAGYDKSEIYVYIRGGRYPVTSTISFSAADSGNENTTVVYKAYNGEKVEFVGSQTISPSKISKVTNEDKDKYGNKILDRIIDSQAKKNLYKIDLSEYKGEIPIISEHGYGAKIDSPIFDANYRPMDVFINNNRLESARWPNATDNVAMLTSERVNGQTIGFKDDSGRTAKWNAQGIADDGYVELHKNQYWYSGTYKLGSVDAANKTFIAKYDLGNITSAHPFFFYNILEEIDMPGESFIDRENKICYFYPSTKITGDADIQLSTFDKSMVLLNGAKHITFEGLNFSYTRENIFYGNEVSDISVKDCVISHTSGWGGTFSGYRIKFDRCHIYDTGYGGIRLQGGDRKNLIPSDSAVTNCIFSENDVVQRAYSPAVKINAGIGFAIKNNHIYNNAHNAIFMEHTGINDVTISNNDIHDVVTEYGDAAAIYWYRNVSSLGFTINNNYLHQIGNPYCKGWSQSIFGDDFCMGAEIYNNIFYQGTLTEENGGTTAKSYPFKTNQGQFFNVHNNIFVDSPAAAYFQASDNYGKNSLVKWILFNTQTNKQTKSGTVTYDHGQAWKYIKDFVDDENWMKHYGYNKEDGTTSTIWGNMFKYFSTEKYEKLKAYADAKNEQALFDEADSYAPSNTNNFTDNLCVKISSAVPNTTNVGENSSALFKSDVLSSGNSMFKEYGKDFMLTEEGLAEVRKTIPNFQNIDTSVIGAPKDVDGLAPSVSDALIIGNATTGGTVKALYSFTDPDGDSEGNSKFTWYASDTKDGNYTKIDGRGAGELLISDNLNLEGKYVKFEMTPYDSNNIYGDKVESAPIFVSASGSLSVDKTVLSEKISEADELIKNAVVGTQDGMYPQGAVDALKQAFNNAAALLGDASVYQHQVDKAANELAAAINTFKLSVISSLEFMSIKPILADTENWYNTDGNPGEFKDGKLIINNGYMTYSGAKYLNKIFTFKLRFEPTDDKAVTKLNDNKYSHKVNSAVFLRASDDKTIMYNRKNTGYLFWLHNDTFEAQQFNPDQTLISVDNDVFTEYNKDYTVAAGVYDVSGAARFVLYVDGKLAYEHTFENSPVIGKEGYLGFYGGGDGDVRTIISPAEIDFTKLNAAIAEAEGFLAKAEIGSGYGQYPADKKAALEKAIAEGKATVSDSFTTQLSADRQA
ncbi:MAG: right-handed parallel beta-helix repeat-containing protein, partial [Clostridia bacterium]|nr:right-handed parallel beta-helix repeat-containing protein [Clostridia bacterium]